MIGEVKEYSFQKCFEDWKERWHKCIISEGGYFEGGDNKKRVSEVFRGLEITLALVYYN